MKRILVPTDFSDNALKAATYAVEVAARTGASVHLLHASGIGHDKFTRPVSIYEKYNNLVLDESNEKLQKLRAVLEDNYPGISFFTEVEPEQHTVDAIKAYVEEHHIDLVIMGTKGSSGIKSVLMGSTAASTISDSKVPVLTLPSHFIPSPPGEILLAINHFDEDPFMVDSFMDILNAFSSVLHVVLFINPSKTDIGDQVILREKHDDYVRFIIKKYPSLEVQARVLEGDSLEDALELYSLQNDIDIISLISHRPGFFDRIFLKSTTRNMTFHSRIPVLAIPGNVVGERTRI
jgi:nucleotide-binding universal stress UspA family protein